MASVLLIISGSIAAYKSLELIRVLRNNSIKVRVILTDGGAKFITPLSCAALSGEPVYTDLFSLTDETEMGHIRLAREAQLVVVAPASADFIAKAAQGRADDLASAVLLSTKAPLLMAPAMNVEMWNHPATQANIRLLKERGVSFIGPEEGELACGEIGLGKMTEPSDLGTAIVKKLEEGSSLKGLRALITAGPTQERIDPVRFLTNASSGKQGYAIAEALHQKGAEVILVSGPSALSPPPGVQFISVQCATDMWKATESQLPVDIVICSAAVSDWRPDKVSFQKIKKTQCLPSITLTENPDILASLSKHEKRPRLLIGFAAETENLLIHAKMKLAKCDWVIANDVNQGVFGSDNNEVYLITPKGHEAWPKGPKKDVAKKLATEIEGFFK